MKLTWADEQKPWCNLWQGKPRCMQCVRYWLHAHSCLCSSRTGYCVGFFFFSLHQEHPACKDQSVCCLRVLWVQTWPIERILKKGGHWVASSGGNASGSCIKFPDPVLPRQLSCNPQLPHCSIGCAPALQSKAPFTWYPSTSPLWTVVQHGFALEK